ncbi:recombination protein NinG [Cronobacter muytjensii]|uniref:recombination protein NinG n=1 Tax=Cronobacter muytjensii TaxID=413501 RepID=UPI002DBC7338|nr:recombination protein NinG [Cronobacter muytjensii]MEB8638635.1 recombination protein NinG [Cronobacter muytjensii]
MAHTKDRNTSKHRPCAVLSHTRKPSRRTCKICGSKFTPNYDNERWCCPDHGAKYALQVYQKVREKKLAKQRAAQRKEEKEKRAAWRQRKAAVKPRAHWVNYTQRIVNDYIRESELVAGLGCISCGTKTAAVWHAGHYRTTAAAGHLRFNHKNIHLQCNACNVHKSGNIELYRANLVALIGEEAVQALENDNTPHRWTVQELAEIRKTHRALIRALKKQENAA